MGLTCHVIQHVPFESAGVIADWAESRGLTVAVTHAYDGEPLPPPTAPELLVSMGGPMGARDAERLPWLADEITLLRERLHARRPTLGVCLGAQLMAVAAGAAVACNPDTEIGWFPVTRTPELDDHWLATVWPDTLTVLHWHGDTFTLPEGARRIATSAACANQGFLLDGGGRGEHALALQCHLESTPPLVEALIEHDADTLAKGGPWVQSPAALRAGLDGVPAMHDTLHQVLDAWREYWPVT